MKKRTLNTLFCVAFAAAMIIWIAVLCSGCKDQPYIDLAYKSLKTAAVSYDTIMSSAADLRKQGKLPDRAKNKITEAGLVFWGAYHSAVDALILYAKTGDEVQKGNYEAAWDEAAKAIDALREHLKPFIKDEVH
jgi:hypothetical protein